MSLDIYLNCPCCNCELYSDNITHNLGKMADAAGIYQYLWRPDELGVEMASELIAPLEIGLAKLIEDPEKYSEYNDPKGWGLYEHFVTFVRGYLDACVKHPKAKVSVWR